MPTLRRQPNDPGQELYFTVEDVEVELQVAVTKGGEGGVTAKFWVLEVGGKGTHEAATTQTIKLKLKPRMANSSEPVPIGREPSKPVPIGRE